MKKTVPSVAWVLLVVVSAGCIAEGGPGDTATDSDSGQGPSAQTGGQRTSPGDPDASGDPGGPGSNPGSTASSNSENGADDVNLTWHSETIDCLVLPPDAAPSEDGETYLSCSPVDPMPFNDEDRKPWVAAFDLTEGHLAELNFRALPTSRLSVALTWSRSVSPERIPFEVCRTAPGSEDGSGKACFTPSAGEVGEKALAIKEFLFGADSPWKEPGSYEIWIEPAGWSPQGPPYNPHMVPDVVPELLRDVTFTLEATLNA